MAYNERIELARGRILSYLDQGDRDLVPILFCHDSPGCRLGAAHLVRPAVQRGGRMIAPDRPMGGWLAAMLPDVEPHYDPEAGHLACIIGRRAEALDWLIAD